MLPSLLVVLGVLSIGVGGGFDDDFKPLAFGGGGGGAGLFLGGIGGGGGAAAEFFLFGIGGGGGGAAAEFFLTGIGGGGGGSAELFIPAIGGRGGGTISSLSQNPFWFAYVSFITMSESYTKFQGTTGHYQNQPRGIPKKAWQKNGLPPVISSAASELLS